MTAGRGGLLLKMAWAGGKNKGRSQRERTTAGGYFRKWPWRGEKNKIMDEAHHHQPAPPPYPHTTTLPHRAMYADILVCMFPCMFLYIFADRHAWNPHHYFNHHMSRTYIMYIIYDYSIYVVYILCHVYHIYHFPYMSYISGNM